MKTLFQIIHNGRGSPQPPRRAAPHRVLEGFDDDVARGVIVELVQPRPRPQRAQGGGGAVAAEAGGEGVAGVQPIVTDQSELAPCLDQSEPGSVSRPIRAHLTAAPYTLGQATPALVTVLTQPVAATTTRNLASCACNT